MTDRPTTTTHRRRDRAARTGSLQRLVRRHSRHATRDSLVGVVVTSLVIAAVQLGLTPDAALQRVAVAAEVDDDPIADSVISASMVGDVMFARHVERAIARHGYDALLVDAAPLLVGDYVSANLEQVVSDRDDLPDADKLIHLRSDTQAIDTLVAAGFTTVSLANNHTMDHGLPGLGDTISALDDAGVEHAGAGEDLEAAVRTNIQEHGELTVATLSFTDVYVQGFVALSFQGGVLSAEPDRFVPLIQRARSEADLVIAHFHWGNEYDIGPSRRQRELATLAAAAGADIVVGHHPHVLMPVERIGDTLVLYSLGNFVFDQGWSRTRETAIARYHLGEDGQARVELLPMYIREGAPRQLSGISAPYRRARIHQRLRGDGLEWHREGDALVTTVDHSHVLEGRG